MTYSTDEAEEGGKKGRNTNRKITVNILGYIPKTKQKRKLIKFSKFYLKAQFETKSRRSVYFHKNKKRILIL